MALHFPRDTGIYEIAMKVSASSDDYNFALTLINEKMTHSSFSNKS